MIRDFFLVLVGLICLELGIRYLLVIYHFERRDKITTQLEAEQLATDLRDIMLNSGGPIAARTIYPIFKRNREEIGLQIAIIPSKKTVTSIRKMFDFEPRGIPPQWSKGEHHEYTVELRAEKFCTKCHVDASVGDVLGHVTVRSYLSTQLNNWWNEVKLTSVMGMANVLVHTIVLFFLLKIRMEPLLSLRSTISNLAKGGIDLTYRAKVKSHDEFGELALDLNAFLDRLTYIVEDLQKILKEIVSVTDRMNQVNTQMDAEFKTKHAETQQAIKLAFDERQENPVFTEDTIVDIKTILSALDGLSRDNIISEKVEGRTRYVLNNFKEATTQLQDTFRRFDHVGHMLIDLSNDIYGLTHFKHEIEILEEKMRVIAESGQILINRLTRTS